MRFTLTLKQFLTVIAITCSLPTHAAQILFSFDYLDAANEGFNDPIIGSAARSALEYAGSQWSNQLAASYAGETIHVSTFMDSLGAARSNTLASASASGLYWNNSKMPMQNTIYGSALANHFVGRDLNASANEIKVTFNTDKLFYFGTDFDAPNTAYDFVSVAMHEMGHGLGFFSRIDHDNSDGSIGGFLTTTSTSGVTNQYPSIYDRFLVDAATGGTLLTNMTDAQRAAAITSGDLYWSGANAVAANGGERPELYAPDLSIAGSSIVHFDPATHFLLDPNFAKGEDVLLDTVTLNVLKDIGWTIASALPEPPSFALMLIGLAGIRILKKRTRRGNNLTS